MKYCTHVESTNVVAMEHFVINGGDENEDVVVLRHSKGLCIVTTDVSVTWVVTTWFCLSGSSGGRCVKS